MYCRKSSEAEDRQMLSIESQRSELQRYAERENLTITEVKEEARSAKAPGRPLFNEMLRQIECGNANGILAWHPDRLARNALDGGQIIHLLDMATLADLRFPTYSFENTSQGKFMLAIMFGQSKYYVDALSENVRRGNRTKREKGWLPGRAPIGYLNARANTGEKIIVPDPDRFPALKQLWHLLLTGGYSVPQLLDIATNDLGLRTPKRTRVGGRPLSVSGIYRVFANPFYGGHIVYDNQWYPGRHEPMITVEQFERAQDMLGRTNAALPKSHVFPYTGLMRCGFCGCSITAEIKVNRFGSRYVYYHCGHKKRDLDCREQSVEQKDLEAQILAFLESIYLDRQEVSGLLAKIEEERAKEHQAGDGAKRAIQNALESCTRSLDNLTKMRYRELISDAEFLRQREELAREQIKLNERLTQLEGEKWVEPSRNLFFFSNRAAFWLTHGSDSEKRLILSTAGSNPLITSKKLSICAKEPFRIVRKYRALSNLSAIVNDVRTYFCTTGQRDVIPLLPDTERGRTVNLA